jgi:hypothetical protein
MKKKVPVYIVLICLVLSIILCWVLLWALWNQLNGGRKLGEFGVSLVNIAKTPNKWLEHASVSTPLQEINKSNQTQTFVSYSGCTDSGYILVTGYDKDAQQTVVKLFSLRDNKVLLTWKPDLNEFKKLPRKPSGFLKPDAFDNTIFRTQHPWLTNDSGIILKGEYGIIKLDKNSKVNWFVDGQFHHPTEQDADGNFWMGAIVNPTKVDTTLYPEIRDDAIANVSPEGKILFLKSITELLIENGYRYLVGSVSVYEPDAIHLNDIQPVLKTGPYWQRGDVFISMRNKSTLLLYRPSTNKVIWLQTGPWMNQHDISIIDSARIGVLNNSVVRNGKTFKVTTANNNWFIYNFKDHSIDTPYAAFFAHNQIATKSEGRVSLMPNGDILVEETNYGRLMRGNNAGLCWSYVNLIDEKHVGIMGWTRYYTTLPWQKSVK